MTRQQAYQLLTKYLNNPNLIKHCLATEAVMKTLYFENTKVLPKNPMDWAITCCDQLTGLIVACAIERYS